MADLPKCLVFLVKCLPLVAGSPASREGASVRQSSADLHPLAVAAAAAAAVVVAAWEMEKVCQDRHSGVGASPVST